MVLKMIFATSPVFTEEEVEVEKLKKFLTLWSKAHIQIRDEENKEVIGHGIYIHVAYFQRGGRNEPDAACRTLGLEPYILQVIKTFILFLIFLN
jgi:hypothetical protein